MKPNSVRLKVHPAAELFPMMTDGELDELAADIKTHGQSHPIIVTSGNLVLDGRNRLEACRRAGVEPEVLMWDREDDGVSPAEWVLSENMHRRHLTPDQRASIVVEAMALVEAELETAKAAAKERMREGGKRKGSAPGATLNVPKGKASAAAAKKYGMATRTVERAKRVKSERPELFAQVRAGDVTLKQAEKTIVREHQIAKVRAHVPPVGEFGVIVVDPPWSYEDKLDGSDAVRGATPYPTMSIEEIRMLELPVAKDCCVFLWVTNSHLVDPMAYAIVANTWQTRYGLVPKQIRTWVKTRMGLGRGWRNITEHLVRLERGSPVLTGATQTTMLAASPGAHSEKPAEAYRDIEALCASTSRLEMFARAERAGWVTNGAEAPKARVPVRASAVEPGFELVDDGTLCGVRPSKTGDGCIHKQGHEGIHSNRRITWRSPKKKLTIVDVEDSA